MLYLPIVGYVGRSIQFLLVVELCRFHDPLPFFFVYAIEDSLDSIESVLPPWRLMELFWVALFRTL